MGRPVHTLRSQVGRRIDDVERVTSLRAMMSSEDSDAKSPISLSWPISAAAALAAAASGGPGVSPGIQGGTGGGTPPGLFAPSDIADVSMMVAYPEEDFIPAIQTTLPEVEDRRLFHPEFPMLPIRRTSSRPVRRLKLAAKGAVSLPVAKELPVSDSVILCIRRKNRRGVILALGQGGGFHRPPRRSPTSDIWC